MKLLWIFNLNGMDLEAELDLPRVNMYWIVEFLEPMTKKPVGMKNGATISHPRNDDPPLSTPTISVESLSQYKKTNEFRVLTKTV